MAQAHLASTAPELVFRPLGPEDREGLAALFDRLGPQSRYRRFLSPKFRLTPAELTHLTAVDGTRHDAVAAIDPADGSIVGVARAVRLPDRPDVADTAVEVADAWQGLGVGTDLMSWIVRRAGARGVTVLAATTLWENGPARALLKRLGFRVRGSQGATIELELSLEAPSASASASRELTPSLR